MNPRRIVLDAGPCLNFCATSKQRLLLDVMRPVGSLHAPDVVDEEIQRKARTDRRFEPARRNWLNLVDNAHVTILDSQRSPALEVAVARLSGTPFEERMRQSRDLGELLVMAHAIVLKDAGHDVVVMIDEVSGQRQASRCGLSVIDTGWVLAKGARAGVIEDRAEMRRLYDQLRSHDDGLVRIEQTRLLHAETWR